MMNTAARAAFLSCMLALSACAQLHDAAAPGPGGDASGHSSLQEPVAGQRPFTVIAPQGQREDPWFWLRDDGRDDPDVIAYLQAENAYYEAWESHKAGLLDTLYEEIVGRIKQDEATVPVFERGYWYYARFEEGRQHPVYARRRGDMEADEEILLDVNRMAEGHAYFQVGDYAVSDDNRLLAWMEDTVGRYQYVLRVRDLRTGDMLHQGIERVSSFAWAADNSLLYVENHPVTLLSYRVRRHEPGAGRADEVVYEEADGSFYVSIGRSRSADYLLISLESTEATELRMVEADDPAGEFRVFQPRQRGHLYHAEHLGDRWIVRSNWQAPNYRLMSVPAGRESERDAWADVLPHSEDALIEDHLVFDGFMAVAERSAALQRIRIVPWDGEPFYLAADDAASSAWLGANPRLDTTVLRYAYTSLNTPLSVYEIDIRSGQRRLLKRQPVLGDFEPENYHSERLWAPAGDGELIPVSLVYRKGFKRDGSAPLYQYGYGSYGASRDPSFHASRLSLLDRGFVFAIAHVRGGQELGRRWYDDGRLLQKTNTFNDFIDVTRFLVQQGYAAPDRVFAVGGSAGGLLVGAVANMAPELYAGMVAHVPFVDIVNTMLDDSIPLTSNEYDEWGNPALQPWYDYMLSYSPYDNVRAQAYPPLFVTTGLHDSQVQYWESAKWVAKLRATRSNAAPILFRINMDAGHGGNSGRFDRMLEIAREYAFILDQAGISE